jgi:hypothetical protein
MAVLAGTSVPTHAQDCESVAPELERLLPSFNTRCRAQLLNFHVTEINGSVMLMVDRNGALRGVQSDAETPVAVAFPGGVAHFGHEDETIYWGLWQPGRMLRFEGPDESGSFTTVYTIPYLAGMPYRSISTPDRAEYAMVGQPFIISKHQNANITTDTDVDGAPIDPGPITNLTVRLEGGKAFAELSFSARGVPGRARLEMEKRSPVSPYFDAVSCDDRAGTCPFAELHLYGSDAEYAGLLFNVSYQTAMPEGPRVAARLNGAKGIGAVALKRR